MTANDPAVRDPVITALPDTLILCPIATPPEITRAPVLALKLWVVFSILTIPEIN